MKKAKWWFILPYACLSNYMFDWGWDEKNENLFDLNVIWSWMFPPFVICVILYFIL